MSRVARDGSPCSPLNDPDSLNYRYYLEKLFEDEYEAEQVEKNTHYKVLLTPDPRRNFMNLTPSIIAHCFSFISFTKICKIRSTCKLFNRACLLNNSVTA